MQKQLSKAPSDDKKALTKLSGSVILREQPAEELIRYVAYLIDRLSKLYQMANWTAENTVIIAEWICENYPCEMLQTVDKVLRHPPKTEEKNWRLTPDTIRGWMETELETVAMQREHWNHSKKFGDGCNTMIEGLEEHYKIIRANALKKYEVEEEIKKMQREERTRRYGPVDMKSIEEKRDNEQNP